MIRLKLACLFSGGKDSTLALHIAKQAGHEIVCLIAMRPENAESFLFHTPNMEHTKIQAEVMHLPLVLVPTSGKKTQEYKDLLRVLHALKKTTKIEGILTGAVYSTYQASRIQKMCAEVGLVCFDPLWQSNPKAHWHELFARGFKVMLVSVAAHGLDEKWLGKIIDEKNVHDLYALESSHGVSSLGEGGEFESFVLDAPLFHHALRVTKFKDTWKGLQGTRHIQSLQKVSKHIAEPKKLKSKSKVKSKSKPKPARRKKR